MFQKGSVVYFKKAKGSTKRSAPEGSFKGYGFGILLGHAPPFAPDVPAAELMRLLGQIGFVSFDDVGEILGPEQGQKLVELYTNKYYGRKMEEIEKETRERIEKNKEQDRTVLTDPFRVEGSDVLQTNGKPGFDTSMPTVPCTEHTWRREGIYEGNSPDPAEFGDVCETCGIPRTHA